MTFRVSICTLVLVLGGCNRAEQVTSTSENATEARPSAAVQAPVAPPPPSQVATNAYADARKCLLDVSMRTMTDDPSGGPSTVNSEVFDLFKAEMIRAGAGIGKSEAVVMSEFRQLVTDEAARVGAMPQSEQEEYVLATNSSGIRCLQQQRSRMAG